MTTILEILQHALVRDEYGRRKHGDEIREDYRNHFCTGPGSADFDRCAEAVSMGLMREHPPRAISGGDHIFTVTEAGKTYIHANSPALPKISRSKARYLKWLSGAGDCGVPFGEWLKGGAQ